jgi:hypothetical protein
MTRHRSTTHIEIYRHSQDSIEILETWLPARHHDSDINGATAFYRMEDDGKWYVSIALCCMKDQFCRKTGRQVARRKYFQGKKFPCSPPIQNSMAVLTRLRERSYRENAA